MSKIVKRVTATFLSLSMLFCWVIFAPNAMASSYATAECIRIYGSNRYETANRIAASGWTTASTVVLASANSYPDALAGAPLAYKLDAPILLVSGNAVQDSVMQQIYKFGASKIVILGGPSAVSQSIETELLAKNFSVDRIWGQNRYETAVRVAERLRSMGAVSSEAFVVSGENYPDALAVSPVAALKGAPIVYSNKNGNIDANFASLLSSSGIKTAYIIGGTSAIGTSVSSNLSRCGVSSISRISGNSRYETALKVADFFINIFPTKNIAFATGEDYPDALAGGVFAAKKGMPVLLTNGRLNAEESSSIFLSAMAYNDTQNFTENLVSFIDRFGPEEVFVFGGEKAVPNVTVDSYFNGTTWNPDGTPAVNPPVSEEPEEHLVNVYATVYESFLQDENYTDTEEHGDPISGVSVSVYEFDSNGKPNLSAPACATAKSDNYGKFALENLKPEQYLVTLSKKGFEDIAYQITLKSNKDSFSFDMLMYRKENSTGTISGSIAVKTGSGSSSGSNNYSGQVYVIAVPEDERIENLSASSLIRSSYDKVKKTINGAGSYSLTVSPGSYILYLVAQTNPDSDAGEYAIVDTASAVVPSSGSGEVTVNLSGVLDIVTTATVSGYVMYDNEPVKGATVTLRGSGKTTKETTDADGFFSVEIPAGTYTVRAEQKFPYYELVSEQEQFSISAGQTGDMVIHMGRSNFYSTINGVIIYNNEYAIPGMTVRLLDEYGRIVASDVSDSSGEFTFSRIPYGVYTLDVDPYLPNGNRIYGNCSPFELIYKSLQYTINVYPEE